MDQVLKTPGTHREGRGESEVVALKPRASGNLSDRVGAQMRIALIGNFAPRKCGIATFTSDIYEQLARFHPEVAIDVYALQDADQAITHDAGVYAEIDRDDPDAYARAARRMNADGVDAVWLQHEFGIFGGEAGGYVLDLVDRIAAPLVVTMHTVLAEPDPRQEAVMRRLVERASRLMVMCRAGRDLLTCRYGADHARIENVEHGAPDCPLRLSTAKGADAPMTLMTFGLLGPGKGLETAIEALPAIVSRHPGVVYRIVGVEHPNELRTHGESYRRKLEALADRLGVSSHLEWVNRFLETDELIAMLADCDIYLTPYPNLQQSTSGTLSYAVALGRAVVSTPYIHARELLEDTGGMLVDVGDAAAIANTVNRLFDNPSLLEALQLRTYRRGRQTTWQHFAGNSKALLEHAIEGDGAASPINDRATPGLAAFDVLCDGTGMLQHAHFIVPDRSHGYCLDDNARALMLMSRVVWANAAEEYRRAATFASFIQHAWNPEAGAFRNFMNFDRTWCEDCGSEDSNGRAIWALGDAIGNARHAALRDWALDCFESYGAVALGFGSPRAIAFAALGAAALLERKPHHGLAKRIVSTCGHALERLIGSAGRPDWTWFEKVVGYDNPRLSQALIACGQVSDNPGWIAAGLDTLRWILLNQRGAKGQFRPIGSDSFGREGEILPFDQQPLEAWAAIDACVTASRCEPDNAIWVEHARRAYRWFFGENDRGAMLVDLQLGSCRDGVTPHGANRNCGAESVLAFQLAHYSYARLLDRAGSDWRQDAAGHYPQRF